MRCHLVNKEEFMDLFGIWTEEDEPQFSETIKDFEPLRPEDSGFRLWL